MNGIWVGKFETSLSGNQIQVKPNVRSLKLRTVKSFFTTMKAYNESLDSHMIKNTEWGAVAYLSHSKFGINSEVRINNNSNYLTGYAAVDGTDQSSFPGTSGTDENVTLPYNTTTGFKASTTGNITGIYDMSGGAWEYVAAYMPNSNDSSGFTSEELSTYSKYFDVYVSGATDTSWNKRILGDATGELGPFYYYADVDKSLRYHNSWYDDYSYFIHSNAPWFNRGGFYGDGALGGLFVFGRAPGFAYDNGGSRLVLAVK